jgi:hypothetical protein
MEEFWIAFGMQSDGLSGRHAQSGMLNSKEKAIEWAKDCLSKNLGVQKVAILWSSDIVERQVAPIAVMPTFHKEKKDNSNPLTKKRYNEEGDPLPLPRSIDADIVF